VALRRWGGLAMALPVACYAAVWLFGLAMPSLDPDGQIAFNPFAWQILFLGGAWLGRRALLGGQALNLPAPALRVAVVAALAVLTAGLVMRLTWYGFAPWPAPFGELYWIEGKQDLSLPRLVHALALALVWRRWCHATRRGCTAPCRGRSHGSGSTAWKFLPRAVPVVGRHRRLPAAAGAGRGVRGAGRAADRRGQRGAGGLCRLAGTPPPARRFTAKP